MSSMMMMISHFFTYILYKWCMDDISPYNVRDSVGYSRKKLFQAYISARWKEAECLPKKMEVRHAPLEPWAPNKSTSILCHQPVNLIGIDNCEDRRCVYVWMWLGIQGGKKEISHSRKMVDVLAAHDKTLKNKKPFSQLLLECWVK